MQRLYRYIKVLLKNVNTKLEIRRCGPIRGLKTTLLCATSLETCPRWNACFSTQSAERHQIPIKWISRWTQLPMYWVVFHPTFSRCAMCTCWNKPLSTSILTLREYNCVLFPLFCQVRSSSVRSWSVPLRCAPRPPRDGQATSVRIAVYSSDFFYPSRYVKFRGLNLKVPVSYPDSSEVKHGADMLSKGVNNFCSKGGPCFYTAGQCLLGLVIGAGIKCHNVKFIPAFEVSLGQLSSPTSWL